MHKLSLTIHALLVFLFSTLASSIQDGYFYVRGDLSEVSAIKVTSYSPNDRVEWAYRDFLISDYAGNQLVRQSICRGIFRETREIPCYLIPTSHMLPDTPTSRNKANAIQDIYEAAMYEDDPNRRPLQYTTSIILTNEGLDPYTFSYQIMQNR